MLLRLSLTPSTIRRSESCQRGLAKKTQFLLGCELCERLGDAVGRQLLKAIGFLLFVPYVVVGGEEIMIDDGVSVLVEKRKLRVGRRAALVLCPVNLVAARIFAFAPLGGKEDRIVVQLRVVVGLVLVVLPPLHKKYACLGAGVGLEGIAVKTNDGENAALVRNVAANLLVGRVVEAPLGKNDCHASTRTEELDIAFNEENIAADALLRLDILRAEFITRQKLPLLHLAGEWRIGHHDIELKIGVRRVYFELTQFLVALVICVDPRLVFRHGIPTAKVECVQMKDVCVSVARNQV